MANESHSSRHDGGHSKSPARERATKKQALPSPYSARKSNRLEKHFLTIAPGIRKSERIETHVPSAPSGNSSSTEKTSKQLSPKTRAHSKIVKQTSNFAQITNARVYRSSFKSKNVDVTGICQVVKGTGQELDRDGINSSVVESRITECDKSKKISCAKPLGEADSGSRKSINEIAGDEGNGEHSSPVQRCRHTSELVKFQGDEAFLVPKSANSPSISPDELVISGIIDAGTSHTSERFQSALSKPKQSCCPVEIEQQQCQSSCMDRGVIDTGIGPILDDCGSSRQQRHSSADTEVNAVRSTCFICKLGGKLLCCDGKGCQRSFHSSCLNLHPDEVTVGVWFCFWCVRKKIELGVHSVSEGIESIWDVREVEVSGVEGLGRGKGKQYLVKYRGLAHVHDNWVAESQLQLEAPELLLKFNKKNQDIKWMEEWTAPHRLLKKRPLVAPKVLTASGTTQTGNHYEWLVKWHGLDYEHVTWELESASFFNSSDAQRLMKEYENRHVKINTASDLSQTDKEKKGSLCRLSKLPGGDSVGSDMARLCCINKLRDKWRKGHNCVVFDDQDRIAKIVLFILSLQNNACLPFLIISTTAALTSWNTEFFKLAPSVSAIVYSGSKQTRELIRKLEFFGDDGSVVVQVILSSPEAVIEDFEALKILKWEAVIIDECAESSMSTYFEQFKMFIADMRLVLISSLMKDSVAENISFVSFIGQDGDLGVETDPDENIGSIKERLSQFILYESSSRFVEYWVPVSLSNIQLEQYCSILSSNAIALRSASKNDLCGALPVVFRSIRKCCDHPRIVDPYLHPKLTTGLQGPEILNFDIKASGKLQVLDKLLPEIKNQGLRALILFHASEDSGRDVIGDILDDYLHLKFGPETYERLAGGVIHNKKKASLNKFNNKECGRFVFLLEHRACLPSIKLSSVDIIILFNSDLNPLNDLRAFQKITIEQNERIKVFRLYYPFTIEEKVLILSKQSKHVIPLDIHMQRSASQNLLMWGASFLFKKLDEFHRTSSSSDDVNSELSIFNGSADELLALVSQTSDISNTTKSSFLKVQHSGGTYCQNNIVLPGELEIHLSDEKQPHLFWARLLEGKFPKWKYLSRPSTRNRKRVQYTEESPKQTEFGNHSGIKKRKKDKGKLFSEIAEWTVNPADGGMLSIPMSTASVDLTIHSNDATSPLSIDDVSEAAEINTVHSEEKGGRGVAQNDLHLLLKPELSKLCEVLQLSGNVKGMVGWFLDYIMNNLAVTRGSMTILQALQLSLCWIAASKLGHEIDHVESIVLARQHLSFSCQIEEVESVYSKLLYLKDVLSPAEYIWESDIVSNSKSVVDDFSDQLDAGVSQSTAAEPGENLTTQGFSDLSAPLEECSMGFEALKKSILEKYNKKLEELCKKQQEEIRGFEKVCDVKKMEIRNSYEIERNVVRSMFSNISVKINKLRSLDKKFAANMDEHERKMMMDRKNLEAKQIDARNEFNQKKNDRLEEVDSLAQTNSLDRSPSPGHPIANSSSNEKAGPRACIGSAIPLLGNLSEENPNHIVNGLLVPDVASSELDDSVPDEAVASGSHLIGSPSMNLGDPSNNDGFISRPSEEHTRDEAMAEVAVSDAPSVAPVCIVDNVVGGKSTLLTRSDGGSAAALYAPLVDSCQQDEGGSHDGDNIIHLPLSEALLPNGGTTDVAVRAVEPDATDNADNGRVEGNKLITGLAPSSNRVNHVSSDRPVVADDLCDRSPSAQGLQNEYSHPSSSTENKDVVAARGQNMTSNHLNHDAAIDGSVPQLLLEAETYLLLDDDAEHELSSNEQALSLSTVAPVELPENTVEVLDVSELPSLSPRSPRGMESHRGSEYLSISRSTLSSHTSSEFVTQGLNNRVAEHETTLPNTRILSTRVEFHGQPAQPVVNRVPPVITHDPLLTELERFQKEMEKVSRTHEDTKLQLKSDCDKEIEEAVAEIRRRYDTKIHDVEAAFSLKMKELDANRERVSMNKMLAEAFRSKCTDHRTFGAARMLQDIRQRQSSFCSPVTSSVLQQHLHPSLQHVSRALVAAGPGPSVYRASMGAGPGPSMSRAPIGAVQGPSVASPSMSRAPIAAGPSPSVCRAPIGTGPGLSMPRAPMAAGPGPGPPLSSSAAVSLQASPALLPIQHVHRPARPPQINSLTPSTGNYQVVGEFRAPAPHLQSFRLPSSMPFTSALPLPSPPNPPVFTSIHPPPFRPSPSMYMSPQPPSPPPPPASQPRQPHSIPWHVPPPPTSPSASPAQHPENTAPLGASGCAVPPPPLDPENALENAADSGGCSHSSVLVAGDGRPGADAPHVFDLLDRPQLVDPNLVGSGSEIVCLSDDE